LVNYQQGKAIRSGVPICWPWFGAHPTNVALPGHGYARITNWELAEIQNLSNGATVFNLTLGKSKLDYAYSPNAVRLELKVTVGATLEVALTTTNLSDQDISFTEGLHTYFQISDIANIRVLGLEGSQYIDLVNQNRRLSQLGSITFNGELGRIFLDNQAACVIEDPTFKRRIRIEKTGSNSTAVWNPGLDVASKMNDLGAAGWRDMVCVESANALVNAVTILPGSFHRHSAIYSVEYIEDEQLGIETYIDGKSA
jgi:D-hexose-6-phosphate mutarotase